MKIAVIHNGGSVGGWRWVCAVFGAIKKYYPEAEITIICQKNGVCPDGVLEDVENLGIKLNRNFKLNVFEFNRKKYLRIKFIDNYINHLRKNSTIKRFQKRKNKLIDFLNSNFDIVFNSWPFSTEPLELKIPYLFIPHDFIMSHYFGHHVGNVYNQERAIEYKNIVKKYIDANCIPCVTTNYIAEELRKTVPSYKGDINQVMILLNNNMQQLSQEESQNIMRQFEINNDYIILATNDMHHKNTHAALTAYYYIKQRYPNLKMIIVGYGMNDVRVKVNSPYYADHIEDNEDYDIKSLGLVSDFELNALIQNAKLLLNVSLCEAACGSGLDAWSLETPTAISNIPPYLEQVKALGVKTEFFNPKNCEDIAAAVLRLLDNPEYAKENAKISKEALKTVYTEKDMADGYMKVFKKYVGEFDEK